MMQEIEVHGELLNDIVPPAGWQITDGITEAHSVEERESADGLKRKISTQFPVIAETVEYFIAETYESLGILITNAVVAIHADATFHILLLVNQEDFFSPRLSAAKLHAKEFLATIGTMSMQYKFVSAMEYFKSYYALHSEKLRFGFKNPQVEEVLM